MPVNRQGDQAASLCLVIPCYNEARRLDVESFRAFLDTSPDVQVPEPVIKGMMRCCFLCREKEKA